jgi:hypothetical protein
LRFIFFYASLRQATGQNEKQTKGECATVARQRNPNRDEAMNRWLDSGGTTSTKDLAAGAGVPESRIRKWKCEDKWQSELDKKKQGGQPGNKNAAGHGAPVRNRNAETHGAYSEVRLEDLTSEEWAQIETITLDTRANILRELKLLSAKERALSEKIAKLESESPAALFVDRVVEMLVPKAADDTGKRKGGADDLKTAMRTVIKASPFDRAMKLETELNKTHGRIIKLVDTMKSYDIETRRLDLDRRKYQLMKQKATGEYDVDPETGEINDDPTDDETDELDV